MCRSCLYIGQVNSTPQENNNDELVDNLEQMEDALQQTLPITEEQIDALFPNVNEDLKAILRAQGGVSKTLMSS